MFDIDRKIIIFIYIIIHMYKHISAVLSGELFDIVINSLNSKYGRLKIISSITHGIFSPLSKYIIELENIMADTFDDKSSKRTVRLQFLKECLENDTTQLLQLFFQYLLCWLNGGGDKPSNTFYRPGVYNFSQYKQKLIVTSSGGNIITIFAKLLKNIAESTSYDRLTFTNKEIIEELHRRYFSSGSREELYQMLMKRLLERKPALYYYE